LLEFGLVEPAFEGCHLFGFVKPGRSIASGLFWGCNLGLAWTCPAAPAMMGEVTGSFSAIDPMMPSWLISGFQQFIHL
jgi:hypothetical protein